MFDTRELQNDLRVVAATPEGRRLLWDILAAGGLFADAFAGESTHVTARALGRKSITLELWAALNDHAPASMAAMLAHQHERRRAEPEPAAEPEPGDGR